MANLTRGAYSIEVSVFDTGRQLHLARVSPAATFNVSEQVSHQGVANLFVAGSRRTTGRGRPGAQASELRDDPTREAPSLGLPGFRLRQALRLSAGAA